MDFCTKVFEAGSSDGGSSRKAQVDNRIRNQQYLHVRRLGEAF